MIGPHGHPITSPTLVVRLSIVLVLALIAGACDAPTTGMPVTASRSANLSVSPPVLTLDDGETGLLSARLADETGRPLQARSLEWSSLQPGVASVRPGGIVDAKHPGEATIRVRSADFGVETEALVIVRPVADDVLFLVRDEVYQGIAGAPLEEGVEVRVIDRGGLPVPGVAVHMDVESGGGSVSPSVAVTDANGYARAEWTLGVEVGANSLAVTDASPAASGGPAGAPGDNEKKAKVYAWGNAGVPRSITLTPTEDTLTVDESDRLKATVLDKWDNEVEDAIVSWSSDAPSIATVDPTGNVVGVDAGTTTIVATAYVPSEVAGQAVAGAPANQTVSGTARINVIRLDKARLVRAGGGGQTGPVGEMLSEALTVRVKTPSGEGVSDVPVSWAVSRGGGTLTATSATTDATGSASVSWTLGPDVGTQEVSVWAEGVDGGVIFTATATVGEANEVVVTPVAVSLESGGTQQLNAVAYDVYGNLIQDRPVNWSSSEPSVASVDVGGFVTAGYGGTAEVVARLDGASGSSTVTVTGDGGGGGGGGGGGSPDLRVTVSPAELTLNALGAVGQLTATVTDETGSYVGGQPVWSSTNPDVATVDNFGRVTSHATGTTRVTATVGDDADTTTVTVNQVVALVVIDPPRFELTVGDRVPAKATAMDSMGTVVPDAPYVWHTTSVPIVGVDKGATPDSQIVKARDVGEAAIYVESDGITGWAPVVVTDLPVASITVTPETMEIPAGGSGTAQATLYDEAGDEMQGRSVQWSSSNTSIAVVENGVITGLAEGQVQITARADDKSDMVAVTVTPGSEPPPPPPPSGQLAAFPGAEGWGATALGACDRTNVEVLRVTNLNDSGSGSLRAALENADNNRLSVVVFDVAGIIDLSSRVEVRSKRCLYVAGQTAPGSGITVRNWDGQSLFIKGAGVSDLVFRYLRFRNGTRNPGQNTGSHGMIIGAGERIVLDHLSFSWTNDQLLSIYGYAYENGWGAPKQLTVQRSLFSEPLASSPVCYATKGHVDLSGGSDVPQWYRVDGVTIHHNAAIHCSHRAPGLGSRTAEVINNVVYNWHLAAMHTGVAKVWADYVGNYFKAGPMNRVPASGGVGIEISHVFRFNRPGGWSGNEPDDYVIVGRRTWDGRLGPAIYLDGNEGPSLSGDQWSLTSKYKNDERDGYPENNYDVTYGSTGMPTHLDGIGLRRTSPMAPPPIPVSRTSAGAAYNTLISQGDVGANRRLSCSGDWVWNQDPVDARVIRDAQNGTGRSSSTAILSQDEVGGFPSIDRGTACRDSDGDGMPDDFETRYDLNPGSASDAGQDPNGDGYVNLEAYLNGISPR